MLDVPWRRGRRRRAGRVAGAARWGAPVPWCLALAAVLAACVGEEPPPPPGEGEQVVTRVVDGDTIEVSGGQSVRLIGIDTPETRHPQRGVECFGREASRYTASLLPEGTRVRLVMDVEKYDRYDRILAYVYRVEDGLFVNAKLVEEGYAQPYTVPPNVAHAGMFARLAREAREQERGLWRRCRSAAAGSGEGWARG